MLSVSDDACRALPAILQSGLSRSEQMLMIVALFFFAIAAAFTTGMVRPPAEKMMIASRSVKAAASR